jgi:phosphocarrier protein
MPENCEATFTLTGDLHARPAGALSVAAAQFSSAVQLAVGGGASVDAKSVLSVMQLGASSGQEVTVRAVGPDAQEAVDTLIGILSEATKVGDLRFAFWARFRAWKTGVVRARFRVKLRARATRIGGRELGVG